jgi:hypothetical protein
MNKRMAMALLLAPSIAWPCGGEDLYPIPDSRVEMLLAEKPFDAGALLLAERKLDEGDYQGVINALDGYQAPRHPALWRREVVVMAAATFRGRDLQQIGARAAAGLRCPETAAQVGGREALAAMERMAAEGVLPDRRGQRALLQLIVPGEAPGDCGRQAELAFSEVAQAQDNIQSWMAALRSVRRGEPQDPVLAALYAEGLSLLPNQQKAARRLFEDLAARELLPDAAGWAALARLRLRSGDHAGAAGAVARCRQMARDPAVCPIVPVA